jgi:hypothetical protein
MIGETNILNYQLDLFHAAEYTYMCIIKFDSCIQRIFAERKRTGIEKCGVCAAFNTAPSCLPGKLKTKACNCRNME